jgi:putative ABC transport system permease protein
MEDWRRLFGMRRWGPELDEGIDWELRHHVEERVDELVAQGRSEAEAREEAWRELGDATRLRGELRRIGRRRRRSERVAELGSTVVQDVRYGMQSMRRNAVYAAAIVVTLALGIGANGALFSVADALLLRPLPYDRPEELVQVFRTTAEDPLGRPYLSPSVAREWLRAPAGVATAFMSWRASVTYIGGTEPRSLPALAVTESFEETLGVTPAIGRGFTVEDMVAGAEPVVLRDARSSRRARRKCRAERRVAHGRGRDAERLQVSGVRDNRFLDPARYGRAGARRPRAIRGDGRACEWRP